ncbi:MAG: dihydrodipicolinate synthase family protein [Chloroflexi bacterium]|nr:dihydrodipicolinate synthase family protein [Chloroflexota bacterium]MCI0578072.1 dihydrodipicolinate synthase family protein [Chloroflexota bacterium]MCI0646060.1 dihydrodipicolinate synthase family protein [Chloroflexota bacterium]MCI0731002.1 dihydrodipicolinate synthase family protein [Chloroflexota bacterium]
MIDINLRGMVPAAVLPMTADYQPDYDAYARYLEWLISENAVALAINMDTGEGPQLTVEERRRAAEVAVEVAAGACTVVAGVMGATTAGAVEMAKIYRDAGVDGLVVFPSAAFRNDPLDRRIPVDYHRAIAEETGLPIILFQLAPVFGGVNFSRETLLHLLEIPQVVAVKEASFDAQYFAFTKETLNKAGRPITLLTGNDRFITESFLLGAEGALLGFGAIGCGMVADMIRVFAAGDYAAGVAMKPRVQGFADVIYADPVLDYRARCKVALAHIGVLTHDQTYVRPPLLQISPEESERLRRSMVEAGMLQLTRA